MAVEKGQMASDAPAVQSQVEMPAENPPPAEGKAADASPSEIRAGVEKPITPGPDDSIPEGESGGGDVNVYPDGWRLYLVVLG